MSTKNIEGESVSNKSNLNFFSLVCQKEKGLRSKHGNHRADIVHFLCEQSFGAGAILGTPKFEGCVGYTSQRHVLGLFRVTMLANG